MTLSPQYVAQIYHRPGGSLVNEGTIISLRVSFNDAEHRYGEFGQEFQPRQFVDLPRCETLIRKQSADGAMHFQRTKLSPPIETHLGRMEKLIRRSRQRFATPRAHVEAKLARWLRRYL